MNGFLCFYKREGITSFGALAEIRRCTGEKKLGHCGTLDPMATGVLPVAFGRAAKFIEWLPDDTKEYVAAFQLGVRTDTLDRTGTVLSQAAVQVSEAQVQKALTAFVGEGEQIPPMFSAVSKNGVRLYELARQGIVTEREARKIRIDEIDFLGRVAEHTYRMRVKCKKGVYIRSLIGDLGDALGCGAVMTALERTASNGFALPQALTIEQVRERAENGSLDSCLIPVDKALAAYPVLTVTAAQSKRFRNGGCLDVNRLSVPKPAGGYRVYDPDGLFLGMGALDTEAEVLQAKKLFVIAP